MNLVGLSYQTGDILYYDGSQLQRLAIGSVGEVLTVSGGIPDWQSAASGYTDEMAQDAIGGMVNSTLTYVDATPSLGLNLANVNTWTAKQTFQMTTNPIEIGYDASNYLRMTVGSTGLIAFTGAGTGTGYTFTGTANVDTVTIINPNQNAYGLLIQNSTFGTGNTKATNFLQDNVGRFRIYNNNIVGLSITSTGLVGVGGNFASLSTLGVNGGLALGGYSSTNAAASGNLILPGKIGIGVTSPNALIDASVNGGSSPTGMQFTNTSATAAADVKSYASVTNDAGKYTEMVIFGSNATGTFWGLTAANLARFDAISTFVIGTGAAFPLIFATNSAETGRFDTSGNFGVGTGATVSAKTHIISTTEQLRQGYDTSNYFSTTVGSTGGVTFNAVGSGSAFTFSDKVNLSDRANFASVAGTAVEGDMWADSTQKSLQTFVNGVEQTLSGVLFTQTNTVTVANTVTETALTGTGVGTLTLPANFFVAGKTIRFFARGFYSSTANPDTTVKFKLGSTVIMATATVSGGNGSNDGFVAFGDVTCRTTGGTGTVFGQGQYLELHSSGSVEGMVATSTVTIDTTATQAVSVSFQWGTASASNTISCTNFTLEAIN